MTPDDCLNTRARILRLLADGALHSGADLGRQLGISRAAVFKSVRALSDQGVRVTATAGQGYRLEAPLTPLDSEGIRGQLRVTDGPDIRLEIVEQIDSTNRYLLEHVLTDADPCGRVCLAEVQDRGRGRRGRSWIASAYRNLMLSMAWRFATGPGMVAGLSLAAGVGVVRALEEFGVTSVGIKWPNDVLWTGGRAIPGAAPERKLAGLLVDVHGEASGPCTVVLGVGVNCHITVDDAERIDQPWVDIRTITGQPPDRNRLAALLVGHLHAVFQTFAASGFAAFAEEWNRCHVFGGRLVRISQGDSFLEGVVDGVEATGALRLRMMNGTTQLFHAGEVSLRPAC
ncbi:MAG: biotin--[acetyl-CoA-carboxylase] ligase [Sulfurifustis sp.]